MSSQKHSKKSNRRGSGHHGRSPHGYGGVRPSKSLGQNFLIDEGVIEDIVLGSGAGSDALVIEIGPGTGALTLPLAERAGYLVCVELDDKLIEPLRVKTFGMDNVEIVHEDILKLDLDALIKEKTEALGLKSVRVVGNLPYYITTPIIMKLLETAHGIDSITVMMQKEVGDRIAAEPGTRASGAITYPVHYYARVSKVTEAAAECFYPAPKVDSVVLRLDLRDEPAVEVKDAQHMFRCVKAGFSQRRKTIHNSLASMEGCDRDSVAIALDKAGIDPGKRAENLTLEEFAKISDCLQDA